MKIFDIAVIGAGPAGCMAAIRGAQLGKKVILLEKNDQIGRKLLLTGHGRCNLTNIASIKVFLENFGKSGTFYREVFNKFSNQDLMDFFASNDLELTVQEEGRVFPITEKSKSVVEVLKKVLEKCQVKVVYNYRLIHLQKHLKIFNLSSTENQLINALNVIIATGGASYQITGSTGDGFTLAKSLGHHITELTPGGVPLLVGEEWVHELKGVTLDDIGLNIKYDGKIRSLPRGSLLFTHFGISGPVILDMSQTIVEIMDIYDDLKLYIDFKPGMEEKAVGVRLIEDFKNYSKKSLRNYLKNHLPQNMINPILKTISLDPQKKLNQITKKERLKVQKTLKNLPVTITGHLPLDKALVTCGGVSRKEINPKTMESKLVNRLYFAGEIISGCGRSGGYNLQQAFSTGYVAGTSATENNSNVLG